MKLHRESILQTLALLLVASSAHAQVATDAGQILVNVTESLGGAQRLVTGAAYLIGVAFVFRGIFLLKLYGQALTMSSSQTSIKGPLIYLCVGVALIILPTTVENTLATTFGSDSILAYSELEGGASYQGITMNAVFGIVQFVGIVAFIRGWVLVSKSAGQGAQGTFGKGLTHIIGGILAINIVGTMNLVQATLGVSFF